MKKNYLTKASKAKKVFVLASLTALAAVAMSFGPMFFGPGLTQAEPFTGFLNNNFPDVNLGSEPYQVAYENVRFDWPLTFTAVPNQNTIVIGQLNGKIYSIPDNQNTTAKNLIVDFSNVVGDAIPNAQNIKEVWDGGLLGLEMHPDFGTAGNNYVYIYYTTDSGNPGTGIGGGASGTFGCFNDDFYGSYLNLERFEVNPATMEYVANSNQIMMKRRMLNSTHRGGAMEFGDDGFLYIATGEQGRAINAQNITDNLDGGVLRIDVDMDPARSHAPIRTMPADAGAADEETGQLYWIPNNNPFQSPGGATFEEYFTVGNRSPHRMSKDSQTGLLYIGEVGQSTHEEINIVNPSDVQGKNFGWPVWEGNIAPPNYDCGINMLNAMLHETPLVAFDRADAVSIIGGHVYRGTEFTSSIGKFITADWGTRKIFSVDITTGEFETLGTLPREPISFGESADGNIYYLTQGNNVQLLRYVEPGVTTEMPQTLTATGAFTDLQNLIVADGFIPYEMIDPFWSDGATKKRWLAIPNDGDPNTPAEQIQFSEDGVWEFPVGSVIIKHFDYPIDTSDPNNMVTRKLETRFSIKNSNENWTFLSYKWNAAQTEADLVDMSTGENRDVAITTPNGNETITWRYPSTNECLNCHNDVSKGTLGPRTRYLNSEYDYSDHDPVNGTLGNQLVTLSQLGLLNENITDNDTPNYLTHTSIDDPNGSLEDRARSYMDLNCAYCHQPGAGGRADFDLRLENSLVATNLLQAAINEPIQAMGQDQKILSPGDAAKSHIYYRANSLNPGIMMPRIAKGIVDEDGVALLEAWINQLNPPPIPVATIDEEIVNINVSVPFTGSGSTDDGSIVSYAWDFGDGGTAAIADPQHTFTVSGMYAVTLTVTDNDGQASTATVDITVTGGTVNNVADADVNLALLPDAILNGSVMDGRGTPEVILYDPVADNYATPTPFNEYGVAFNENIGQPTAADGFVWQTDWLNKKLINYITFGGTYPGQPQPNTAWAISYRTGDVWTILEQGVGGWIDSGIFEWGGQAQAPLEVDAIRVQLFSNGIDDVVSVHLRGRGGISTSNNDSAQPIKATLIQYLTDDGSPVAAFDFTANDLEVTFDSSNSTDDLGIVSYAWDFGDGNTSTDANPVHAFPAAGSYDVTLTLTDADGLTDIEQQTITVSGISTVPVAIATSDVTVGPAPLTVNFTGDGSTDNVGVVAYAWDFGDGATSTDANPSYQYTITGLYEATLTVTDADGQESSTTINILADGGAVDNNPNAGVNLALLPDALLSGSVTDGRGTPQSILYDPLIDDYFVTTDFNEYGVSFGQNLGTPDADNGFRWQVDWAARKEVNYVTFGGVFETQPQPNSVWRISYRTDATWTTLEEGVGGWINAGIYEWGGPTQIPIQMDGLRVQVYSDGTNDLVSIHLRGRGGVSNLVDDSEQLIKATLIQYLPDTGAPESEFEVVINELEVTFDSANSTDDVGIVSYTWDFGDGNGSTMPNPVHTYAAEGTYNVTLTVTDGSGLSDVSAQDVTVAGDITVPVAIATSDVAIGPAPLTVQFTGSASTDDVGIVSYAWDFGNGDVATVADPNYSYTIPGNYTVTLTVTDGEGLTNTTELNILATGGPVNNNPNSGLNLALLPDALVSGSSSNGRGTPQAILYDPAKDDYFVRTDFNEYGVPIGQNLGTPDVEDGFRWQVDWVSRKEVNYITFGGVYDNQPQPNSLWRISYRVGTTWTVLEEGTGGWIDSGIYEWGGPTQIPLAIDGLRVQVYSDGTNDLISIHLRGRGGISNIINDSGTATKATLVQLLPDAGAPKSEFTFAIDALDVTFDSSLSSDDLGIVAYEWDFSDGNVSTDPNPTNVYAVNGPYTVTLTVTDADGLSDTSSQVVTLGGPANEAPVAIIGTSLITGAAPLLENFTGSDSTDDTGIVSYAWDFGDGSTSIEEDPAHTYTQSGVYRATLTVTDAEGLTDEAFVDIIVTNDVADNAPNAGVNIALAPDAILSGSPNNTRGSLQDILYNPARNDYFIRTNFNEYGVAVNENLGTPSAEDGFRWQVDWAARKQVNYITFGGVYPNQPQPNSLWRISYRVGNDWIMLEEGVGGWIDAGIYEWGGMAQQPIDMDGLRVQVFSDGTNELISIHLRGRGGNSFNIDDRAEQTKATLIQFLPDATAPESDFEFVIDELQVDFDSSSSSDDMGITDYLWDFGDGNTSTEANPVHIYSQSGTYEVSLTVTDADGKEDTSATSLTVVGNGIPIAVASSDIITGVAPLTVAFVGSGSTDDNAVTSYTWDFGDGGTATEADPTYVFNTIGEYGVTLTVSDAEGQTNSTELTITVAEVNLAPVATTTSDVVAGEAPLTVSFTGSGSTDDVAVVSYMWDFGDGTTATDADPVHIFDTPGAYEVTLTVTDAEGLTDSTTLTITVEGTNAAPVAVVSSDVTTGAVPLTVSFTGRGSTDDVAVVSYLWDFGDGTTATDADPVYIFDTLGEYEVTLTVTDAEGLTDSTTLIISVVETNAAPVAVVSSDVTSGEAPLMVSFTGSGSTDDEAVVSYAWDFGDGGSSTEADPVYAFNTVGEFEVVLVVTDAQGLTDASTVTITVNETTEELQMILAPNPAVSFVEIELNGVVSEADIIGFTLHDSAGRLVRQYMPTELAINSNGNYEISLDILMNETYVVTVILNNEEPISKRLILRR